MRARIGRVMATTALVAATALAAGCSDEPDDESDATGTSAPPSGLPTLLVQREDDGSSMQALTSGELNVTASGCVGVGETVIVAPAGSAVSADGTSVTLASWGTFTFGEEVRLGGGEVVASDLDDPVEGLTECLVSTDDPVWFVGQGDEPSPTS